MYRLRGLSIKSVAIGFAIIIVIGGLALTLLAMSGNGGQTGLLGPADILNGSAQAASAGSSELFRSSYYGGASSVYTMTATSTAASYVSSTTLLQSGQGSKPTSPSYKAGSPIPNNGSLIEFFSNVTLESRTPSSVVSELTSVAYAEGGYVAYSSSNNASAFVVIRVPAQEYQKAMAQVQTLGNVTSTVSTSNDVTVQYTDLQAQLASLQTEQQSLLRILNESTSVNSTLTIEQQLQQVDEQINITESQMLQTERLVEYSTISVTIVKSTPSEPLTLRLTATPKSGTSPLSVTLNAVVQGGSGSYLINYNFGDGTSQEGQAVIHQYYGSGDFNVTVTATDSKGNSTIASTIIRVVSPPQTVGATGFFSNVTNLFVNIVEGMVEVAVVVVPIGLVLIALALPLRRRLRLQKEVKQS